MSPESCLDGEDLVAEVDSNGDPVRSYVHGPGIDNLLAFTDYTGGSTNTYYALTDHLGTVTALADETGAIVESYEYDAWGNITVYDENGTEITQSQYGNRFTFQGREYSWSTGLYNFRARWYDPVTGRWLSKDPIGIEGGLNQYVAFGNNPVNAKDPYGLSTFTPPGMWSGEHITFKDWSNLLGRLNPFGDPSEGRSTDEDPRGLCEVESRKFSIASISAMIVIAGEIDVGVIWDNADDGGLYIRFAGGIGVGGGIDSTLLDWIAKGSGAISSSDGGIRDQRGVSDWYAKAHVIGGVTQNVETQETEFSIAAEAGGGVLRDNTVVIPIW